MPQVHFRRGRPVDCGQPGLPRSPIQVSGLYSCVSALNCWRGSSMLGLRSAFNPNLPSDMTYPRILPAVPNDLCSPGELLLSSIRVPHYRHNGENYMCRSGSLAACVTNRLRNKHPTDTHRWRMFLAPAPAVSLSPPALAHLCPKHLRPPCLLEQRHIGVARL